jgi:hypothetical protein
MRHAPPELVAALNAAVDAEREARGALRDAQEHQAEAVRALREAGFQTTSVARYVAARLGLPATPSIRQRLAARLRQRVSRVTRRHAHRERPAVPAPIVRIPSEGKEVPDMARLIKRTTTETFEVDEGEELDLPEEDDVDADVEEVEEEKPKREKRPPPHRRR